MKIENLRSEKKDNRTRVSAQVKWEDGERPLQEIYFETVEAFSNDISCNPHAFLVACIMPALRFGEKRIFIDAEICPELKDGLVTAMGLICNWFDRYNGASSLVRIETKPQKYVGLSSKTPRAGFLFSGGIDSLATLRANRIHYSPEHPGYIKDGILIYGLEVYKPEDFENVLNAVSILAKDAGVTLIPVYTNIKDLGPEDNKIFWGDFWIHEFMGATFAAVAHAFSKRLSALSINSCHDIPNLMPYSSHPLLNPYYSSSDLKIRHEGIHLSRLAKTELVSGWDLALRHLRVCNKSEEYNTERLNCGKCEKCVRTMLAFQALGVLEKTEAFPVNTVSVELVNEAVQLGANTLPLYHEIMELLAKKGQNDLVQAIEHRIEVFYHQQKIKKLKERTIEPIIEFDRKYLKSSLKKVKNSVFDKKAVQP
jgi:hypothetical protein